MSRLPDGMDLQIKRFIADRVRPEYRSVAEGFVALVDRAVPELKPGMRGGTEKYIPVPVWRLSRDLIVMSPSQKGITISFANGALLGDPAGLLRGIGKKTRTMLLRNTADLARPELADFLSEAVALGASSTQIRPRV